MTTKPLWQQLCEMGPEEQAAMMEKQQRQMQAGEMTEEEAKAWAYAWRRCAEEDAAMAEALLKMGRLAKATGCPKGTPLYKWLLKHGLIKIINGKQRFTSKAKGLRLV